MENLLASKNAFVSSKQCFELLCIYILKVYKVVDLLEERDYIQKHAEEIGNKQFVEDEHLNQTNAYL